MRLKKQPQGGICDGPAIKPENQVSEIREEPVDGSNHERRVVLRMDRSVMFKKTVV